MSVEEIVLPEITTPTIEVKPTHVSIVPVVLGVAFGIGATLATNLIVDKLKKAKAEKDNVVVPEETPKTTD